MPSFPWSLHQDSKQSYTLGDASVVISRVLYLNNPQAASPFHFSYTDAKTELLDPALIGTTSILKAIKDFARGVKRVVITSSFASMLSENTRGSHNHLHRGQLEPIHVRGWPARRQGQGIPDLENHRRESRMEIPRRLQAQLRHGNCLPASRVRARRPPSGVAVVYQYV